MEMKMIAGMVMIWMVVGGGEATLSCDTVTSALSPCISYLTSNGATAVPAACCSGIKSLDSQASTTADRRTACNCLEATANSISGINYSLAAALPSNCGVSIPYTISPSTNCSSIN